MLALLQVRCADVGEPDKVVVFHDNSGARPRWFLEAIHVSKKVISAPASCGQVEPEGLNLLNINITVCLNSELGPVS